MYVGICTDVGERDSLGRNYMYASSFLSTYYGQIPTLIQKKNDMLVSFCELDM